MIFKIIAKEEYIEIIYNDQRIAIGLEFEKVVERAFKEAEKCKKGEKKLIFSIEFEDEL